MLRTINEMIHYEIEAKNGTIGKVDDLLFDDEQWVVRYLVADTRKWLPGRQVLLAPKSFLGADWVEKQVKVDLTKDQIKSSPPIDTDQPVHRQFEQRLAEHYSWPSYWTLGAPVGGPAVHSVGAEWIPPEAQFSGYPDTAGPEGDSHLQSVNQVTGYHIQATDGEIGHIDGFVGDDESWDIRYVVVDTKNFLPGRKVLVAPAWINSIGWGEAKAHVDLTRKEIEGSPEFNAMESVNREYEARLYDYYGRPKYWD